MLKRNALALAMGLASAAMGSTAVLAASPGEIDAAIANGLSYLHSTQNSNGTWTNIYGGGGFSYAGTGAAAYAMLSQKDHWGVNAAAYQADVNQAMTYLLSNASTTPVSTRNDGLSICPGGGSCTAVWWAQSGEDSYTTGLVASAIGLYGAGRAGDVATASGPLAGMTWGQIAQGITNTWAASQSTANQGNRWGGWRYGLNDGYDSDSSTTQWGAISLIYDQSLGATTPSTVLTDLRDHWYVAAQAADGSACYQPGTGPCDHADTGGMLVGLSLTGAPAADPNDISQAIAFLNTYWTLGANGTWYGLWGQPYAMWGVYKGLQTTIGLNDTSHITNLLDSTCGGDLAAGVACNWWQDMNQWLVQTQNADGSWAGYGYWTGAMPTMFYLPILGGTQIPGEVTVPEPASLALLAVALAGLGLQRRRRGS